MAIALHLVLFLIFSLAELLESCGCSEGQKVAEPEWACCLAGESAAVYNKSDKRWEMLSGVYTHTYTHTPDEGDGGHNLWCLSWGCYETWRSCLFRRWLCCCRLFKENMYKQKHACFSILTLYTWMWTCSHSGVRHTAHTHTHGCASFSGFVLTSSMFGLPGNLSFFYFLFGFLAVLAASRQRDKDVEGVFLVCAHYSRVWGCGQRCSCAHSEKTTL